jgi:hypothetical protein
MSPPAVIPDDDDEHLLYGSAQQYAHSNLKRDRERGGRCAECGLQTHGLGIEPFTGSCFKLPLSVDQEVHRGRCLLCFPLRQQQQQQQENYQASLAIQEQSFPSSLVSQNVASIQTETNRERIASSPIMDDSTVVGNIVPHSEEVFDIMYMMRRYPNAEVVQERGCKELWVQSWDDDTSSAIGHVGGIPRILEAMSKFPRNVNLQRCACEALQNLVCVSAYNRFVIVDQGGAALIVQAMMRHLDSIGIQHCGCIALASLASSQELHEDIIRAGGGHAAVHSARKFAGEETVRLAARQVLQALGCDPSRYIPQTIETIPEECYTERISSR